MGVPDFYARLYYRSDDVFSFSRISISTNNISKSDRVFFIDDEYSILMDEELISIFNRNEIIIKDVDIA